MKTFNLYLCKEICSASTSVISICFYKYFSKEGNQKLTIFSKFIDVLSRTRVVEIKWPWSRLQCFDRLEEDIWYNHFKEDMNILRSNGKRIIFLVSYNRLITTKMQESVWMIDYMKLVKFLFVKTLISYRRGTLKKEILVKQILWKCVERHQ